MSQSNGNDEGETLEEAQRNQRNSTMARGKAYNVKECNLIYKQKST